MCSDLDVWRHMCVVYISPLDGAIRSKSDAMIKRLEECLRVNNTDHTMAHLRLTEAKDMEEW